MTISGAFVGVWLFAGGLAGQADVSIGDTYSEVVEVLGDPTGFVTSGNLDIYYFSRGKVAFRDGVVEKNMTVSEEEAKQRKRAAARERQALQERAETERERLRAEGIALRDKMIFDPDFTARPPSARLAFWHAFRQKYREVDVDLEYAVAYQEARLERAEELREATRDRRLDRRLNELEERVLESASVARSVACQPRLLRERPPGFSVFYPGYPVVIRPNYGHDEDCVHEAVDSSIVIRRHVEIREGS